MIKSRAIFFIFAILIIAGVLIMQDKPFQIKERTNKTKDIQKHSEAVNDKINADVVDDSPQTKPSTFKEAVKANKRNNIVLLGIEDEPRADTIIFISLDTENKKIDMISIPRDTYYHEEGYDSGDSRKINATYGRKGKAGAIRAVETILGKVPINHYIVIKYDGIEKIVDNMGGVEVELARRIEDIPEGRQILNGKQSVVYLRYRHGYPDADLGRIRAQQKFIRAAIDKLSKLDMFSLASIAKTAKGSIDTDIGVADAVSLAFFLRGIKAEDISMKTLPGTPKNEKVGGKNWSYFFHDLDKVKDLMAGLCNINHNQQVKPEKNLAPR